MLLSTDLSRNYNSSSEIEIGEDPAKTICGFNASINMTEKNGHISLDIYDLPFFINHKDQALEDFAAFAESVIGDI